MQASNSIYWPADSLHGVFYYSATCQFYYNITLETVGNYTVHVSMFPNISNEARIDIAHGINTTLNIRFGKVENLTCQSRSEENVDILCTTTKIFPEAVCLFTIHRNAHKVLSTITHASNSKFWPDVLLHDVFYYSATCQFCYNVTMETVGNYTVHVSMFPNIRNEARNDIAHGKSKILNITFGKFRK
ncbi:uncharacterized protein LOC129922814 [Biomphalaria glabrata]|uniref:Polymorphic transmembrane cluster 2 transmembrane protein 3 n=1 Tax=Biomphalaria glabrata TaxID=6526 RepID=A0A7G8ZAW4_BIOGL|nr:uncharacterized protein LOC129922814 [Biomphalaria glabrata]QNL15858.1 polymorphic transmembrane cluster 2 transmembrane protein 3 [Biomphalaria glabrata]QNL15859.1 polymorphic transmembrane cluster 2 transmembrane protein 3 [Biomphalaria glabrata]